MPKSSSADKRGRTAILDLPGPDPLSPRSSSPREGAVAQMVERLVRNEEVRGSIPLGSTRQSTWDSLSPTGEKSFK